MSAMKQQYGVNADGSVSRCRAKPGNMGRFGCTHGSHCLLSTAEAARINEVSAGKRADSAPLNKKRVGVLDAKINGVDADSLYSGAVTRLDAPRDQTVVAPERLTAPDAVRGDEEKEIDWVMSKSADLIGQPLANSERDTLVGSLRRYAVESKSRSVSPAEEHELRTVLMEPGDASNESVGKLMWHEPSRKRYADYLVDSGKVDDAGVKTLWSESPDRCLDAHRVPARYVNETIGADPASTPAARMSKALSHYGAEPSKVSAALAVVRKRTADRELPPSYLAECEWAVSLNPDDKVRDAIK